MLRRVAPCAVVAAAPASSNASALSEQLRGMKVRLENYFRNEAVPHARRVSWSPFTTPKKQGVFAKLARSNFYDEENVPTTHEPYCEEEIEIHRASERQDIYIFKYNVSPTHMSLRTRCT